MRLRSLANLTTGAALGAGAMYLFDPDHGPERRRDARRSALREGRRRAADAGRRGLRQLGTVAEAAVHGYADGRQTPPHGATSERAGRGPGRRIGFAAARSDVLR